MSTILICFAIYLIGCILTLAVMSSNIHPDVRETEGVGPCIALFSMLSWVGLLIFCIFKTGDIVERLINKID